MTDKTPKPLLRVGGRCLIEHHLYRLAGAGITDIVVNHAHLGPQIVAALGDGGRYGVHIEYSAEPEGALETAGGIVNALPLLRSDPFLVINGDIWTDYPLEKLPSGIAGLAHLVMVDNPEHHPGGDFLLTGPHLAPPGGGSAGKALTFSGIGVYRRAMFEGLPPARTPLAPLLRTAMAEGRVTGEHYHGRWIDVGTPERLARLDAALRAGG